LVLKVDIRGVHNLFFDLTIVLILAGAIAVLISLLRQPSIIAYIITGLIIGPFGYYRLSQGQLLDGLAEIGITLLLFMVGLELDITQLKKLGRTALKVGIAQIIFTATLGYLLVHALGFTGTPAWLIAIALTFSSTVIVVKLLADQHDVGSLYGKLAVGILIVQDLVALGLLVLMAGTNSAGDASLSQQLGATVLKALAIGLVIWAQSKYIFPKVLRYVGKSDELLLIFSLAWALGFAAFMTLPGIGFGLEIGGFVAGLALANSAVHYQISARIKSLRDFFIIIFFIVLGSSLALTNIQTIVQPAIVLTLFVLIGNPLIILLILAILGYKPRTAFMTGIALGQVSEFSFILITLARKSGYVGDTEVSLVTLVGILSIASTAYLITHGQWLYDRLRWLLRYVDFKKGAAEQGQQETNLKHHIVLIGASRLGSHLIEVFTKHQEPFVVVEHNPEVADAYIAKGIHVICGDSSDTHIQDISHITQAKLVISTVPDPHDNHRLIALLRHGKKKPKIILRAHDHQEALEYYQLGADYVLLPHFIGGLHLAHILTEDHQLKNLRNLKRQQLQLLDKKIKRTQF
jgi:Kef-type K+ transport system membrane component KefB